MPALCVIAALVALGNQAGAQEIIQLSGENRMLHSEFEELYRIGRPTGEAWEQFGYVREVAFDAMGRLYVLDSQISTVFVVDGEGNLIREFGREGDGPGEFRSAAEMVVMKDGRVVVLDPARRAYHLFDRNGRPERTTGMGGDPSYTIIGDHMAQHGYGNLITAPDAFMAIAVSGEPPQRPDPVSRPIERIKLAGDSIARDTIAHGFQPPLQTPGDDPVWRHASVLRQNVELSPRLYWGALPDGSVAFSDSSAYAIKIASANGEGVFQVLTRPFQPEPVTDELMRAWKDGRLQRLEATPDEVLRGRMDRNRERERIEALEFYHEIPIVRGVYTTWNGKIWVRRRGDQPISSGDVDVLAVEGRYVGTFRAGEIDIPDAFGPDGLAAFIETGALGESIVVVRRLPLAVN